MKNALFLAICCALVSACSTAHPPDDSQVIATVSNRLEKQVKWTQEPPAINQLLDDELTCDMAMEIALLHNPKIQALFEEIGIAHADLLEAGLFQNPLFSALWRFPKQQSLAINTEVSVTQSVLNLFMIPLRKKVATSQLEQVKLQVTEAIIDLTLEVKETFLLLLSETKVAAFLHQITKVQEAKLLLAQRQHRAGTINDLELQEQTQCAIQARIEEINQQNQITKHTHKLNELLGLNDVPKPLRIKELFPTIPSADPINDTLKTLAFTQRLDLARLQLEIQKIAQMTETKKWWAFTDPSINLFGEKDAEGAKEVGPGFSLAVPIFSFGQADMARLKARLLQAKHEQRALKISIEAQVEQFSKQLNILKEELALYEQKLLPLHQQHLDTSQRFYNVMGLSIYKFLQSKESELQTKIAYTRALKDYWQTHIALEHTVGGELK